MLGKLLPSWLEFYVLATWATLAKEQVQGIGSVFLNSVLKVDLGLYEWRNRVGRKECNPSVMTQLGFLLEEESEGLIW